MNRYLILLGRARTDEEGKDQAAPPQGPAERSALRPGRGCLEHIPRPGPGLGADSNGGGSRGGHMAVRMVIRWREVRTMKVIMDDKEFKEYIEHQRFNLEISELMGRDMKERICVLFDLLTITAGMSREFAFTASQLEQLLEMAKGERPHMPGKA